MAQTAENEVELNCGVYGDATTFSIKIALSKKRFEPYPSYFKVYQAKKNKGEGAWLANDSNVMKILENGVKKMDGYRLMNPILSLSEYFQEIVGDKDKVKKIHVLVSLPPKELKRQREDANESQPKMTTFDNLLKKSQKSRDMPRDGDFLRLLNNLFEWTDKDGGEAKDIEAIEAIVGFTGPEFYIRKEILCVLENFKKFLRDMKTENQFILTGTPGTGKSCILALICFYLAIVKKVPVVWFRAVGISGGTESVTRLFSDGKYYEWIDKHGDIYNCLYDPGSGLDKTNCWFCIDGLNQDEFIKRDLSHSFRLLATSAQFHRKGEGAFAQTVCLVPYWREGDLEHLADKLKLGKPEERDPTKWYDVSGGSLRVF